VAHYAFASSLAGEHGGGIGTRVRATVDQLSQRHRITLIADLASRDELTERFAGNDAVELISVPMPESPPETGYHGIAHLWSTRVYRALRGLLDRDAPDLIQFSDYCGEAAVSIQARRTGDPLFARTPICLFLDSAIEMIDVLNNCIPDEVDQRATYALEQYSLRFADQLNYTGSAVIETYKSFYGADQLAPATEFPAFFSWPGEPPSESVPSEDAPLRLLYGGRLERRKGVVDMVRAFAFHPADNWTLTICGGDTPTASLGASMLGVLEDAARGDSRIEFVEARDRAAFLELIDQHDALVSPSVWEWGPNVVLEALARNRPVLATPVGGHLHSVVETESGMLAPGTGRPALAELLSRAVESRAALRALTAAGAPRRKFEQLADAAAFEQQFADAAASIEPQAPPARQPLVTVVIPFFEMGDYIEETVGSVRAQTYPKIETLIVRDGDFGSADAILDELTADPSVRVLAKLNEGVGAARNFGALQAEGEYIVFLDADNLLHPEFVARSVAALELDREIAYVAATVRLINDDGTPHAEYPVSAMVGNHSDYSAERNWAGEAMTMARRELFDRGHRYDEEIASREDIEFFMSLRRAGRYGHAIPEPLLEYRVRAGSKFRTLTAEGTKHLDGEVKALARQDEVQWTT
jgi:glycosyltransferase involved in cell wall biosynthesis